MMNVTHIYLVENCYGDPNKVYIGKTKNNRKNNHRKTFGEQIIYTLIDHVNSWKYEDWKFLETYWIQQFKVWGFEIMNKNEGGNGPNFHTKETRLKMMKPKLEIVKNKIRNSLLGNKHIEHKKGSSHGNYGKLKSDETKQKMKGIKKLGVSLSRQQRCSPNKGKGKPILQYDSQNNFIQEWSSAREASLNINTTHQMINHVLKNRSKTAGGFVWRYK
jgi:hypothetical protein